MWSYLLSVALGFGAPPGRLAAPRHVAQPAAMFCQTDLPAFGMRRVAWFNMVVDKAYRRQSASVFLKTDNFEARWSFDRGGLDSPDGMEGFDYHLNVPENAKFPVTVNILLDGQLASARIYTTPEQNALVYRDGHIEFFQTLGLTERRVPNIFGHTSMVARAVDADGKTVSEARIPLFDWAWLEAESDKAEKDAEALRRKRRCIPVD